MLAGLVGAPVAGTWLVVAGRGHVGLVVVGAVVLLAWLTVLVLALRVMRRGRAAAGATAPDPAVPTPAQVVAPDRRPEPLDDRGDPRLATMLAIRAAALERGHEEGVDFVVEGVQPRFVIEPLAVRWRGDLLELGFSEKGRYSPLARVATGEEMQRVLLDRLAPRRPYDPDESSEELWARWTRQGQAQALLESDPTAVVVPEHVQDGG